MMGGFCMTKGIFSSSSLGLISAFKMTLANAPNSCTTGMRCLKYRHLLTTFHQDTPLSIEVILKRHRQSSFRKDMPMVIDAFRDSRGLTSLL